MTPIAFNRTETNIPSAKGGISAAVHTPAKETGRLAILCPGFLDTKDYAHLVGLADALCAKGFTVVRFDPTGTWGSAGDMVKYTTSQYLEDIKNVLEYMLLQEDFSYVLLGGHSRGGMVSILYAARDSRISSVCAIMPSSGRSMTSERRAKWEAYGDWISKRDIPGKPGIFKEFHVPYSHVEDRDRYNVIEEVKKVTVPIILIAGSQDTLVHPEDVKEIFDAANEPKKYILLEGISHDYRYSSDEVKLVNDHLVDALSE